MTWGIAVNEVLARRAVHDEYGGSRQGGIASCAKSNNILIFTSDSGKNYGYNYDQWEGDAVFYYTGEGQTGDQVFVRGNLALRDHVQRGQHVRLFEEAARTKVRYLGEFRLCNDAPYRFEEAPDHHEDLRKVIVFRLVRVDSAQPALPAPLEEPVVSDVPIENYVTATFSSKATQELTEMERREAALVERYANHLAAENISTNRNKIDLPYSTRPYYTDLFDVSRGELIEAKGSASRNHVRLAIGQLYDYSRYVPHRSRAVLLPSDPGPDLIQLLHSIGITCIFEVEPNVFVRREPSTSPPSAP